ncbi:unnamed protein product, partial [Heterosigma akashiwo]
VVDAEDNTTVLAPGHFFSEPRNIHSFVKNTQVPACLTPEELGKCHTQEHFFGSRMFPVRYRNESLELNEACHFRGAFRVAG